jgi:hypothetical protein
MRLPSGTSATPERATASGPARGSTRRAGALAAVGGTSPMIACSVVDLPGAVRADQADDLALATSSESPRTAARAVPHLEAVESSISSTPAPRRGRRRRRRGSPRTSAGSPRRASALVEDLDPVADLHHERHVVVDQEHAGLVVVAHRADDGGELGHLALGSPAAGSSRSRKRGSVASARRRRASARRRERGFRRLLRVPVEPDEGPRLRVWPASPTSALGPAPDRSCRDLRRSRAPTGDANERGAEGSRARPARPAGFAGDHRGRRAVSSTAPVVGKSNRRCVDEAWSCRPVRVDQARRPRCRVPARV